MHKTTKQFVLTDVFNFQKPKKSNQYFDDSEEGIECPCFPECNRVDYAVEVAANLVKLEKLTLTD